MGWSGCEEVVALWWCWMSSGVPGGRGWVYGGAPSKILVQGLRGHVSAHRELDFYREGLVTVNHETSPDSMNVGGNVTRSDCAPENRLIHTGVG